MEKAQSGAKVDMISENLYSVGPQSGSSGLLDLSGVPQEVFAEVGQLMKALVQLREAEQALSEASRQYMKLSSQDMRALHYLIVAKQRGEIVTPGMIAGHLRISAASTTKLLNRLELGDHVVRHVHPTDRRAFMIEITPTTEASANETVGRQQARRFYAAARLTSAERATVTNFLLDMAQEISLDNVAWTQEPTPKP